jgi:hypothetical protein
MTGTLFPAEKKLNDEMNAMCNEMMMTMKEIVRTLGITFSRLLTGVLPIYS